MRICIFYASAGHGHKRIAEVIAEEFWRRGLSRTQVSLHDSLDFAPGPFQRHYPAVYYNSVKYTPKLWGFCYEASDQSWIYACLRPLRILGNNWAGRNLLKYVSSQNPDVIIHTHFLSADVIARAKARGELEAKSITVITDYYPHAFWVNPGTDFYWVMSEDGKRELIKRAVPEAAIRSGGIPVSPAFQNSGRGAVIRSSYGFDESRLTILLTTGSFGLGKHDEILKVLGRHAARLQCFVVCGNNKQAQTELDRMKFEFPVRVFGFINHMDELMEASQLMIAKPGGSTATESLAKGLPMVIMDPIPGQESRNTRLLLAQNLSFLMKTPEDLDRILSEVLNHPETLEEKRNLIRRFAKPYAVRELVDYVVTDAKT